MDPLTDIIALLKPQAAFSKPITGRGTWGVRYDAVGLPSFCIVLDGQCWLTIKNDEPLLLKRGDFLLLPSTPAFTMASALGTKCVAGNPSQRRAVRHGNPKGRPDFRMIGGTFEIDFVNAGLLELMSQRIHIRAAEFDTTRLRRFADLIMDEYAAVRPGRDALLQRLLEIMMIEALRWPSYSRESLPAGLVAGLRDAQIFEALRSMHSHVKHGWTVGELAKRVGMSRSAFAARFSSTVGTAPMEYLSRWRMSLARSILSREKKSLDELAKEIGYESASAFSTAFRRRNGSAPGAYSRRIRLGTGSGQSML
jgi:AraC-like DNA-binding protein